MWREHSLYVAIRTGDEDEPPKNNAKAIGAFIQRKAEIDTALARLLTLRADRFNVHPDAAQWGRVGTLADYAELLKRITDSVFREGEYAE